MTAMQAEPVGVMAAILACQKATRLVEDMAGQQRSLIERILKMVQANQGGGGGQAAPSADLPILGNQLMSLEDMCRDQTSRDENIARLVRELEECMDVGGVQLGRFQFGFMKDLVNFISKRAPQVDYSLFIDGFSILHSMDYGSVAYDTALSSEHVVSKAVYLNRAQARVVTSYRTAYPDVFGSSDDKGR
jgi:hypothetical protein